jgi:hypothetical protein
MAAQSLDLFSLGAATPEGAEVHGAATVQARAKAGASFRRGIQLSAGIDFQPNVGEDSAGRRKATAGGKRRQEESDGR